MYKRFAMFLLCSAALWCQNGSAWKEFSFGPPTRNGGAYMRDGIRAEGGPLKRILAKAYGIPEHRIVGPAWIATERYALTAIVDNPDDFQPLMQKELADRFHLVARKEKKDVPVYLLKAGSGQPLVNVKTAGADNTPGAMRMHFPSSTLTDFASNLADAIQRPVFNETGIDGTFDISLSWKNSPASLKSAVKDQLGLDLIDDQRNVELLIIDHIERPQFAKQ